MLIVFSAAQWLLSALSRQQCDLPHSTNNPKKAVSTMIPGQQNFSSAKTGTFRLQECAFPTRRCSVYGQLDKRTPFTDTLTPIKPRFQASLPEKYVACNSSLETISGFLLNAEDRHEIRREKYPSMGLSQLTCTHLRSL